MEAELNPEPRSRLTRIGDRMTESLEADPEYSDDLRVIVMVSDEDGAGGTTAVGFGSPMDAFQEALAHVRAMAQAQGIGLIVQNLGSN